MKERYTQAVREHDERMARICAEIDAQNARKQTNNEPDAMRTDMVTLLGLLRGVRYVQTVGDINTIRITCDRIEQRWNIKTQRNGEVQP